MKKTICAAIAAAARTKMNVVSVIAACATMLAGAVATGPAWASPVLTITNNGLPGTVSEGQTIDYFITVSNIGDSAAFPTGVTDLLPSSVSFVSAVVPPGESNSFNSSFDGDIWTIGTLNSGASTTLDLAVKVLVSSGTISDTAIASATNTGHAPVSATATIDVSATPLPATLPLFAGGLGFVGYLTRRRKKAVAAAA